MKGIILLFFSFFCSVISAKTYYVAPSTATPAGNDAGNGDIAHPWLTWEKAFTSTLVNPGDTVYFRGGVYPHTMTTGGWGYRIYRDGSAGNYLCYFNYPGEVPILDCSTVVPAAGIGVAVNGSDVNYVHFKGLVIRNMKQKVPTDECQGFRIEANNTIIENCTVHNVDGAGFWAAASNNLVYINCDAYDCCDYLTAELPGNDGYGFMHQDWTTTTGSVYYKYCRAWNCGDDGFQATSNSYAEYYGCWSFKNGLLQGGGSGFKMGWIPNVNPNTTHRLYKNCIAAYNRDVGFVTNDQGYYCGKMFIYNCITYRTGYQGANNCYGFIIANTIDKDERELLRVFKNNISYEDEDGAILLYAGGTFYTHDHNSWDIPIDFKDADFISVDSTGLTGPRLSDGSLPDLKGFLKLKTTSKAIDAGIDVGLPYYGAAPDLGAYEYDPEEGMNQYPAISITSPESGDVFTTPVNINIITDASDPDGSVSKVEFYNGSVKIGEKTSAPWSFTWSNVPEGTYNISAVAIDNLNATTPSTPVKITVNQAPPVINQPPSLSITNPVSGSEFTALATISIGVNAADADGLVAKVEFFQGTTKLGEKSSSPWTFNWNNVPAGTYSLTATATDNSGSKTKSSAVNVTVHAYPVISITSPVYGSSFTAPADIPIVANASDPDGSITSVEFFNGTASIVTLSEAPWNLTWNDVAAGTYSLTAVATDNSGLKKTSAAISITVSDSPPVTNKPPVVSIWDVSADTSFIEPAKITITATASDLDGSVVRVEFFSGATSLGVLTAAPWSIIWNDVPEGSYSITAAATDNLGAKTTSSAVSLIIYKKPNQPPLVSIVSPANGQIFEKNDEIMITVAASDPDGYIERIELYDGGELFAEISSSPWTYSWKYVTEGFHIISAVAVDNLNESTISSPVSIEVQAGQNETEEDENGLDLYPNPNDGNFTVAFTGATLDGLGMIDIVSVEGKSIIREIFGNENITKPFDLSWIKSGIYILIYRNKGQIITTKKFIKN